MRLQCTNCKTALHNETLGQLICENCHSQYVIEAGIYRFLHNGMEDKVKNQEISARNHEAKEYDDRRSQNYTTLLDHHTLSDILPKLDSSSRVLDVACGTGRSTMQLAKSSAQITAMDFSFDELQVLQEKLQKEKITTVRLFESDVCNMPFSVENYFDFINCCDFFQHIPTFTEKESLLSNLWRMLKPGGLLSLTSYHFHKGKKEKTTTIKNKCGEQGKQGFHITGVYYYNHSLPELTTLIENAGFQIKNSKTFFYHFPLPLRIIRRIFNINIISFESFFGNWRSLQADRLIVHGVKPFQAGE
jgi:ubiquinone/menaquinone biosynthesis C-methylase UbiE